jgi:phosphoesterase RecJ-like protein
MRERGKTAAFADVRSLVDANGRFLILGHVDPDGDCVGSMLAVALFLTNRGKRVACFVPGEMPQVYRSLPGADFFVEPDFLSRFEHDVVFALDAPTTSRIADLVRPGDGSVVVNIDHHPTNERYGTINIIDDGASATAVLVHRFLSEQAPEEIGAEIASCLYLGILMDTGGFRFKNTNAEALETAARLVESGANPYELAHDFIYMKKPATLRLLADVLASIELHAAGRIAVMIVSAAMVESSGGTLADTEGFVDYVASIDGVELGALLREIAPDETRVSLRSKDHHDVAALAERYRGGGHRNAAGLTFAGSVAEAKSAIVADFLMLLGDGDGTDRTGG